MTKTTQTKKTVSRHAATEKRAATQPKVRISQSALAAESIAELDAMSDKLGLPPVLQKDARRALFAGIVVPTPFTEAVATMTTRYPEVAGSMFDADAARETIAFAAAYAPVARAARELAARIESEIATRRAEVGSRALATYATWKGVVRTPEGAVMRGALKELGALLPHKKRHVKLASTSPTPAPAEAPVAANG